MADLVYQIKMGDLLASQKVSSGEAVLTALHSTLALSGTIGRCVIDLVAMQTAPPPSGAEVSVDITVAKKSHRVYSGKVQTVRGSATELRVTAVDGLSDLARRRFSRSYEKKTARDIVRDILKAASLTAGEIAEGPSFANYLLHPSLSALAHLRRLAETCGCALFADSDGKVHFTAPPGGNAKHRFAFTKDVLLLEAVAMPPIYDSVQVLGEGAASERGQDKAHWLPPSPTNVIGRAALGSDGKVTAGRKGRFGTVVSNGAVRSQSQGNSEAAARLTQHASRPVAGSLQVVGSPLVQPGDLLAIEGIPKDHALAKLIDGRSLRARAVRHSLTVQTGYLTWIEL